jgi:hypothetical protein
MVEGMDVAGELARVARALHDARGLDGTIEAVVAAAAELVPGAEMAAVAHKEGRAVVPTVQTADLVTVIDGLQTTLGEGPCLTTLDGADEVVVADTETDERWPAFGPEAAARGVHSVLSYRLCVGSRTIGSLSIFARPPGVLAREEARAIGAIFAAHASVALSGAGREANLTTALSTRDVIGQAKGVLMERHGLDADEAFAALAKLSQTRHLKLAEVAANVAASSRRRTIAAGAAEPPSPPAGTTLTSE